MTLRNGFTTGSCAAACALASCLWQKDGICPSTVSLTLPEGEVYLADIISSVPYRCGVIKDAGDDPDITNGCEVWANVALSEDDGPVTFAAGEGVGHITMPGLKLPVGEPAINPVPREMITVAVRSVYPYQAAKVTIGITDGENLAKKTFNPRLGIAGGLSILGTTGIVRPMSEEALIETIRLELSMQKAAGHTVAVLVFGRQGELAMKAFKPHLPCIQISNFVGRSLDAAAQLGYTDLVLAGQPGKLVKVAGGIMHTHSQFADGRREILTAHLAMMNAPSQLLSLVMNAVTLDGLIPQIDAAGYSDVWNRLCASAAAYCEARVHGEINIETFMLDSSGKLLGHYERTQHE